MTAGELETQAGVAVSAAPVDLIRALAVFAEAPAPEHRVVSEALGLGPPPDGEEHARLFSFQLYPYASVHLGPEGMMGGEAADRVAGFWRAVGHVPPSEPDHLSALLGLYAALLEAEGEADGAEAALVAQSRAALMHEHLASWIFSYLDRVMALGGDFHRAWAVLLSELLWSETRRAPILDGLPAQLRDAPGLPDPRSDGGSAFLEGVLAPVRSGMILTRADLVRMGRTLDVGLRVGERRYILEHLLAQAPADTLSALAEEAEAWRVRHGGRAGRLGSTGAFWEARSEAAGELLRALAEEGAALEMGADVPPAPAAREGGP